jgi:hypothetical protein
MFEKIGRLAETAANKVSVSRRGFLGQLGQGALAMTGVLGGLLAVPRDTRASAGGSYLCCIVHCTRPKGRTYHSCLPASLNYCPNPCYVPGGPQQRKLVSSCNDCH